MIDRYTSQPYFSYHDKMICYPSSHVMFFLNWQYHHQKKVDTHATKTYVGVLWPQNNVLLYKIQSKIRLCQQIIANGTMKLIKKLSCVNLFIWWKSDFMIFCQLYDELFEIPEELNKNKTIYKTKNSYIQLQWGYVFHRLNGYFTQLYSYGYHVA